MSTQLASTSTTQAGDTIIPGPKILLMGDSGTGKTHSLRTLIDLGITPFVLFLEQGMETLTDLPKGKWHYKYVRATTGDFSSLANIAKNVMSMSFENLTKMQDPQRIQQSGFMDAANACNNFVCDCCGQSFGGATKWKTDRALCLDGLSGLSDMAMTMQTGLRPTRGQQDWGVSMNMVKFFISTAVSSLTSTFVLIAHTEREKDEITGGSFITVKTLGQKLAPDLPKMFSDVIMAERVGTKFTWNTAAANAVTKTRNLPIASGLEASFVPLINGWKNKGGKIVVTL